MRRWSSCCYGSIGVRWCASPPLMFIVLNQFERPSGTIPTCSSRGVPMTLLWCRIPRQANPTHHWHHRRLCCEVCYSPNPCTRATTQSTIVHYTLLRHPAQTRCSDTCSDTGGRTYIEQLFAGLRALSAVSGTALRRAQWGSTVSCAAYVSCAG